MLSIEKNVREKYLDLPFGIMTMGSVINPETNEKLSQKKLDLEKRLQHLFGQMDKKQLKGCSPFTSYCTFYKKFKKSYHVLAQVESIAKRKRQIPERGVLVTAMFMAEVSNQMLTAGYDMAGIEGELRVSLGDGQTSFQGIGDQTRIPPVDDIVLSDEKGILGSIICGPDHERRITAETSNVLYVIYGVPGITSTQLETHFEEISGNVRMVFPGSETTAQHIC